MTESPLKRNFVPIVASSGAKHSLLYSCRVLQFNLLADGLSGLRPDLGAFSRIKKEDIVWEYRKSLLLNEILQYDPDIITVQECDHFEDYFVGLLTAQGYAGVFAVKPNSPCLEVSDSGDGCAIFVKSSKFTISHSEMLRYSLSKKELSSALALASGGSEVSDESEDGEVQAQNQVAIIVKCDPLIGDDRAKSVPLVIATTHLKASKSGDGEAVRACEMRQLLSRVQSYVALLQPCALVVTGDLNACPSSQQGSFRSVTLELIRGGHELKLRSIYNDDLVEELIRGRGVSEATEKEKNDTERSEIWSTWKGRVKENEDGSTGEKLVKQCIDYILYQQPPSNDERGAAGVGVVPRGVLGLYEDDYMRRTGYLPSAVYPSDHIAIAADIDVVFVEE